MMTSKKKLLPQRRNGATENRHAPSLEPGRRCAVAPLREKSSFDVPALQRRTLRNQVMTRRWIETPDLFRMTVHTREAAILIDREQLFVQVFSRADFVVTFGARCDRHIWLQPTERYSFGDVDVARRTLRYVLLLVTATIVNELR